MHPVDAPPRISRNLALTRCSSEVSLGAPPAGKPTNVSAKPKWIASAIAVLLLALVASRQMLVGRHQADGPLLAMPAPAAAPAPMPVQDQPLGISDRKSAAPSGVRAC